MTLAAAWNCDAGPNKELVMATDSRLRAGYAWDCCPKIITMPRSDAVLCFAGSTEYAYPLLLQIPDAVDSFHKSRDRAQDLCDLKGHVIRVFDGMRAAFSDVVNGGSQPDDLDTQFLLGGYSWLKKQFFIWKIRFDRQRKAFAFDSFSGRRLVFAGDAADEAKSRFAKLRLGRGDFRGPPLDMEPFEVLRDMIRSGEHQTVGGPPQLVKVYEHMNTLPFVVRWPTTKNLTLWATALGLRNDDAAASGSSDSLQTTYPLSEIEHWKSLKSVRPKRGAKKASRRPKRFEPIS